MRCVPRLLELLERGDVVEERVGLPASEDAVKAAEERLGRPLPAPLRERLRRNNGGDILVNWGGAEEEWQLHPVWDGSDRETMRRSSNHLVYEQDSVQSWPGFPANAISIATLGWRSARSAAR